ncbi:MAG: polyamine ABC transporter substrate-binding protein [Proteobacteria bacterium]|nr:polyamine ABC transporter substrate-binding protein [Pseudomonadota bacterium]
MALLLAACGRRDAASAAPGAGGEEPRQLNVYSWADYIAPDTIPQFERETGIKVRYDTYDSNEVLETKLLTGNTQFDIVVPTVNFFERQVKAGVYRKLDKARLGNLHNMDPEIMRRLAEYDPGNEHAIPFMWSTIGLGYDEKQIAARLGAQTSIGWSMLFDPAVAAKLRGCGISVLDSPPDVIGSVLIYRGQDPNTDDQKLLRSAFETLRALRPLIRNFDSQQYISDLANGSICLALGWSGDVIQARTRAREAGNGVKVTFAVPREGSIMTLDAMAIPADAPHPRNALLFMNYILRPEVMARITDVVGYPSGNRAALALVDPGVRDDPAIYPDAQIRARLVTQHSKSLEYSRFLSREWTKLKTGS